MLGHATVDASGRFAFTTKIPAGVLGDHTIVVVGTGINHQPTTVTKPLTITAAIGSGGNILALTGANTLPISLGALLLIGIGLTFVRSNRRREQDLWTADGDRAD